MQTNFELRRLAEKKGPDEDDLAKLASTLDEFIFRLFDPLKSGGRIRDVFLKEAVDDVMDAAIEFEQKTVCIVVVLYCSRASNFQFVVCSKKQGYFCCIFHSLKILEMFTSPKRHKKNHVERYPKIKLFRDLKKYSFQYLLESHTVTQSNDTSLQEIMTSRLTSAKCVCVWRQKRGIIAVVCSPKKFQGWWNRYLKHFVMEISIHVAL